MGALFRFVAVIAPSQAMAQSLGVIVILVFILHAGYFMAYPDRGVSQRDLFFEWFWSSGLLL